MNILSCFDGISAGQLALQRSGIKVDTYYASETDKYAISITQKNFPNTIQLGDINDWESWKLPKIDLIMGGSPCQGFSNAGAGLNFEDPRSKLFFVFSDILKHYNPKYFLLENVKMKIEWRDVITSHMGVQPILINSSLVSAQSRQRLYWTNIHNVTQPEDRGVYLRDVIENGGVDRDKSYCIDANYYKGGNLENYKNKSRRQIDNLPPNEKMTVIEGNIYPSLGQNGVIYSVDGKSPTLSSGEGVIGRGIGSSNAPKIKICRGFQVGVNQEQKILEDLIAWRRLTVTECERLQTFYDNYTEGVSNTQRYKTLGNSWTVDIIAHIFKGLKDD